jgi:hypothetical protein
MKKFMMFSLAIAAIVLLSVSCSDQKKAGAESEGTPAPDAPIANPIPDFSVYRFPKFPVRIQYPSAWEEKAEGIGVAFLVPGTGKEKSIIQGITILVDDMYGQRMDLVGYANSIMAELQKKLQEFRLLEEKATTLGGADAYTLSYSGRFNNVSMTFSSIYCLKGDILCVLSYNFLTDQLGKYKELAEKSIASLEFLGQ